MIGTLLGKNYEVIEKLDEGGMGVVYLVEHQTLHKRFAAKVLSAGLASNEEALKRFEIEAHAASKLEHENIVNVTDYGIAEDGRPFLVMELLKGKTLYERMVEGPLSIQEIVAVIVPLCRALGAAHAEGFIHRDVKPENIFLTQRPNGRFGVKVLDFGITRFRASGPASGRLTKMGQALGSPLYMAPEVCRGEQIDHRADIYSIGCLLYQLVCGRPPFYDENQLKVLHLQAVEPVVPPSSLRADLSPELERVILKTLEKDAARRYQSVEELEDDLLAALPPGADQLLHARRTPMPSLSTSPAVSAIGSPSGSMPQLMTGPQQSISGQIALASATTASAPAIGKRLLRPPIVVGGAALLVVVVALLLWAGRRGGAAADHASGAAVPGAATAAAGATPSAPAAPAAPAAIHVAVRANRDGARVELDGQYLGDTPLATQIARRAAGTLTVTARGFKPYQAPIAGDHDIEITAQLEPFARTSRSAATHRPPPTKQQQPAKPPAHDKPDDNLDIRGAR